MSWYMEFVATSAEAAKQKIMSIEYMPLDEKDALVALVNAVKPYSDYVLRVKTTGHVGDGNADVSHNVLPIPYITEIPAAPENPIPEKA